MITGKEFAEYQEERLYSTGDEMLDNLLEKAFCEGYELAQREYAVKDYEGLSKKGQEDLKRMRGAIAKDLMSKRRWLNTAINDVSDRNKFIAENYGQDAKKLGKMFPEAKSRIAGIAKEVSNNAKNTSKAGMQLRGEMYKQFQGQAQATAKLARKYAEGKDKVRTTLGRIAKNM